MLKALAVITCYNYFMEPNPAPPPITPSGGQNNNYEFIMNPPGKAKKSLIPRGETAKQRLLIALAGGGVLLIVIILGISTLLGGKNNADSLLDIAQRQAEIIRVSELGYTKADSLVVRNLAITTKLTIQTSQKQTVERLNKLGVKVKDKDLALKKDSQTDQTLTTAGLNNTFDKTFTEIILSSLNDYRAEVKKLFSSTTNQTEKQLLAASYDGTGLLLE